MSLYMYRALRLRFTENIRIYAADDESQTFAVSFLRVLVYRQGFS